MIITLFGSDDEKPFSAYRSHLDTEPDGGNYDGATGIVAGIICLARMRSEGFFPDSTLR